MSTPVLLRFADLERLGIVRNRQQLANLVKEHGFPTGWLLSPNARVWDEPEIGAWLERRRGRPLAASDALTTA